MMDGFYKPASSISHLILAGASGFALKKLSSEFPLALTSFSLLISHGILGTIKFTSIEQNNVIRKLYDQSTLLLVILPISSLNAELFRLAGYSNGFVIGHLFSSLIPLLTQFFLGDFNRLVIDGILAGNLISMMYYSVMHDPGTWSGGLAMMTGLNRFVFEKVASRYDVPLSDINSVGQIFFTMFALGALNDTK